MKITFFCLSGRHYLPCAECLLQTASVQTNIWGNAQSRWTPWVIRNRWAPPPKLNMQSWQGLLETQTYGLPCKHYQMSYRGHLIWEWLEVQTRYSHLTIKILINNARPTCCRYENLKVSFSVLESSRTHYMLRQTGSQVKSKAQRAHQCLTDVEVLH